MIAAVARASHASMVNRDTGGFEACGLTFFTPAEGNTNDEGGVAGCQAPDPPLPLAIAVPDCTVRAGPTKVAWIK